MKHGCRSIAYTYNDPVIWAEYAIDTANACRAVGVHSVAVTAGYISPQARALFFHAMDAANVDLKAFTEDFYKSLTASELRPVLETLEYLVHETDVWVEVTTLVIPGHNDGEAELLGVPVNDDCGEEIEASHAVVLAFSRAVSDFTLASDA